MSFLKEKDKIAIKERLDEMTNDVILTYFTQELECMYCSETRKLLEEVTGLSDKLSLKIYDFVKDKEVVEKYRIDKVPAIALHAQDEVDHGIRYFGVPSGYEFASLLEDILMLSSENSGLSENIKRMLNKLENNVHLQVFVTPTCPHCPGAVRIAHQLAYESDKIQGDMVEATEFPHLSQRYNVRTVPKTIINEDHSVDGSIPPDMFLSEITKALE